MQTYKFTLTTPKYLLTTGEKTRHAGLVRDLEFTGTRPELFKYIRSKTRTHEQLTEINVKQGDEWVKDNYSFRSGSSARYSHNSDGYSAGRNVSLSAGVGGGESRKQIGGG